MEGILVFLKSLIAWLFLSFTAVPILLILSTYRFFISKLVPFLKPKIDKIVTKNSSMYILSDENRKVRVAVMFGLEGRIELEDLKKTFLRKVIQRKDSNKTLLRPELQQYLTPFCGYNFWHWEEKFNIDEHIQILEVDNDWGPKEKSGQELLQIVEERVLRRKWPAERSPWELLVVHNWKDSPVFSLGPSSTYSGTLVILHMDHVLGDGSTISGICQDTFGSHNEGASPVLINTGHSGIARGVKEKLAAYFFGPTNLATMYKLQRKGNMVPYVVPPLKEDKFIIGVTPIIPVQVIKQIRKSQGVSFTAVVITLLAKAYIKLIRHAGCDPSTSMPCFSVRGFPRSKPFACENDFTLIQSVVKLEHTLANGAEMYKYVESSLLEILNSSGPLSIAIAIDLAGNVWNSLRNNSREFPNLSSVHCGMGFTNVAMCMDELKFNGVNRLRTVFGIALTKSRGNGVICLSSSVHDSIRFVFAIGNETVPEEFLNADLYTRFFMEELEFWSSGYLV